MNPLDAKDIVATLGTIGVIATLFIETGLLVGLFLPGDSLLLVAGIAASGTATEVFGNQLSYTQLLIWAPIAATIG
ncbi:MAG: DedA family protein, partial [Actinobacteria bacterium]|nr:DedA family protein [Actinomycetota bacterium]